MMDMPYSKEQLMRANIQLIDKIKVLENQNQRYREALEFYANEENYKPFDGIFLSSYQNKVDEDGGKKARQVLEGDDYNE